MEGMERVRKQIERLAFNFDTLWFLDVLYNVDIRVLDASKSLAPTACVYVKNFKVFMDICEDFMNKLSDDELLGLILHETLHLALYHSARDGGKHNPKIWNAACDLEVNSIIIGLGYKIPEGGLLPKQFRLEDKLSSENYYDALFKEMSNLNMPNSSRSGKGSGKSIETLDDHSHWSKNSSEAQLEKSVIDGIVKEAIKKNKDDVNKSSIADNITEGLKESASNTGEKAPRQKGNTYGSLPGDYCETVTAHDVGKMGWNVILNRLIRKTLSSNYISSFKRTSRRYGELVKGKIKNHKIDNIIIAVDTSGSIDEELHERFLEEILLIRRQFKIDIRYIQCDTQICDDRKLKRYTNIDNIEIKGGGGTDFNPVFEYIKEKHYKPDALLYFTDGCGDYPQTSNINTVWVLSNRNYLNSYKPPFGEMVFLEDE